MRRLIPVLFLLAVLAVAINDAGRYLGALFSLDSTADEAARVAAAQARDRTAAGRAAAQYAAEHGARLTGFEVVGERVRVVGEKDVEGTWVLGRYTAWRAGASLDTTLVVRRESQFLVQQ